MEYSNVIEAPVPPSKRILELDAIRGFAILGILIMNIQSFSMIGSAYLNPTAYGDLTGINRWVWIISHTVANLKFMTIFAMLFGAGVVLMTGKIESKGRKSAGIHYQRMLWLILIGMVHGYLIWHGDILVNYGVCGLLIYLFRKKSPGKLITIGIILFTVGSLLYFFFGFSMPYWPEEAIQNNMQYWKPAQEAISRELASYRGGWLDQMPHRVWTSLWMDTFVFIIHMGWRTMGLMLMGMAFYKWGVLSGRRSGRFYTGLVALGILVGLPLVIYGINQNFAHGWSLEYSMFLGVQFNYWGSVFISCTYIGTIMLIARTRFFRSLISTLAAVGRMALTNYLMQTLICIMIFYGYGFGLFGSVERMWHPMFIVSIWILQLIWSPIWLKYFRFGPAEWLWRSLTYRRKQPMVS